MSPRIPISQICKKITEENNLKRLPDSEVEFHLNSLLEKLDQLSTILSKEKENFVIPYIGLIEDSISVLKLKHKISGRDKINFSLTIDPTDSGFPTTKDFYLLQKDKENSEQALKSLGLRDGIIDKIRDCILQDRPCLMPQTQLMRFNFYQSLKDSSVLEEYLLERPKFVENGKREPERKYILTWNCLERFTNLPVFYRMLLSEDLWATPLKSGMRDALATSLFHSQYGSTNVRSFISHIDSNFLELHPKHIEKYTIGPFYNRNTQNSPEINSIFLDNREQSILKFTKETVASINTKEMPATLYQRVMGRINQKEIYSPIDEERRMIVPFAIKQKLGKNDEMNNPCKIYAVTKSGDIVG